MAPPDPHPHHFVIEIEAGVDGRVDGSVWTPGSVVPEPFSGWMDTKGWAAGLALFQLATTALDGPSRHAGPSSGRTG